MKEKNKRAFGLAGIWSVVAAVVFTNSCGWTFENFVVGLCIFTPIQFVAGFVFSRLLTLSNQGGITLRIFRFIATQQLKRLPKKKIICEDCGEDAGNGEKKMIAQWACYYDDWWRKEYPSEKHVDYFCTSCMIGNLEGMHTGGGPTAAAFKKVVRIQPYTINQDVDKGKKQCEQGEPIDN